MREFRSGSQILFGHLPEQTVDADAGIWKVKRWNDARTESAIDPTALREELLRAIYPWTEGQNDGGMAADLVKHRAVYVKSLNKEAGISCEPFPRLFVCNVCKRLHDDATGNCQCGSTSRRGQLGFVGFHDKCGTVKTPYIKKCPKHGQRAVRFPGTASATELIFFCPVCNSTIQRGFGAQCDCSEGGALSFTVHRSGRVFTPHGVTMINPPRREIVQRVDSAGGGARAFEWLLDGMTARRLTESQATGGADALRHTLREQGFPDSVVEAMVAAMPPEAKPPETTNLVAPDTLEVARGEARNIALAMFESRQTISDLSKGAVSNSNKALYNSAYPLALKRAGLDRVELVDRFPVLTAQFGYTRGDSSPGLSRLRTYRDTNSNYTIYGELAETEALFIRLDPIIVRQWFQKIGFPVRKATTTRDATIAVLECVGQNPSSDAIGLGDAKTHLTTLIHSYAHALIRRAAVFAGIERSALSELVMPHAFGFFVYAAARGDFVLGGLQAVFESELDGLLTFLVDDEHRCALDPGCADNHSACAVCLHLGEPSCRMFNTHLSRKSLAGQYGYLAMATALSNSN